MIPRELPDQPAKLVLPGFYYKHKHNPRAFLNHEAFYIEAVAGNKNGPPDMQYLVIGRPLFRDSFVYRHGMCDWWILDDFLRYVATQQGIVPRFRRIEDEEIIVHLRRIAEDLYPGRQFLHFATAL